MQRQDPIEVDATAGLGFEVTETDSHFGWFGARRPGVKNRCDENFSLRDPPDDPS